MEFSNKYIIGFALALCLVCSLAVSTVAVALKDRQAANALLDMQGQILRVSGMVEQGASLTSEEAATLFEKIEVLRVSAATGEVMGEMVFNSETIIKASKDAALSTASTSNSAKKARVRRIPNDLMVLKVNDPGNECYVFLLWGNGLWSTIYGYLALEQDLKTVKGIAFYEQGETAGLGGEIVNPNWTAQWPGKKVFDAEGNVGLFVTKFGQVKKPEYQVDGISGATITSVAVGYTMQAWLGDEAYGKFLKAEGK
ncbi:MAG: NADH:ubiquinone reductase (Na(+)-transporting) subunit C [Planctomycetota bacterium]|nr:NADH:ubiquinone reductase (Na(+)-transporting) subunit C [Planctomycetota bacterium]MDA1114518.1 NADH:ubiquinone reductase (Na(+)-transporting) subunit C [Planctomycetota bacterium]